MSTTARRKTTSTGGAGRTGSRVRVPAGTAESTTDRVAEAITSGIRSGIFVPGQPLLEPDLTRRLGISRGSRPSTAALPRTGSA